MVLCCEVVPINQSVQEAKMAEASRERMRWLGMAWYMMWALLSIHSTFSKGKVILWMDWLCLLLCVVTKWYWFWMWLHKYVLGNLYILPSIQSRLLASWIALWKCPWGYFPLPCAFIYLFLSLDNLPIDPGWICHRIRRIMAGGNGHRSSSQIIGNS